MSSESTPVPDAAFDKLALVGTVLGEKYELLSLLGEGGMGAVYLGQHLLMRKRVAVKLLHPDMVGNPEIVARFEREAMAAAHIDHPNIAGASDFGRTIDGAFYLVLEYLEGASLRQILEHTHVLPVPRALRFAKQIALGLSRAHAMGFVHRDLKPENVMVVQREDEPDLIKILDFGIAKLSEGGGPVGADGEALSSNQPLTQQGMMYGTPEYMSPEQVKAEAVDARADLYALGIMLFEMLAGKRPFESESRLGIIMAHLDAPIPSLREQAPGVSLELEALVTKLLAKLPEDRTASAKDLCKELDEVGEALGLSPTAMLPPVASAEVVRATDLPATGSGALLRTEAAPAVTASALSDTLPAIHLSGTGVMATVERGLLPLRRALPAGVRDLPSPVLLLAPAVMLATTLAGLLVLLFAIFGTHPPPPVPVLTAEETPTTGAVSTKASDAELSSAKASGSTALADLARKYPEDRRIWRPRLGALSAERKHVEAMSVLTESVGNDPVVAAEDVVKQSVLAAVEAGGDAADAAFGALSGPLGEPGANLLYDLASAKDGKARDRAWKSLAKPEVRRASPALAALVDLKEAKTCENKRAAVQKVKETGDRRAVPQLKTLRQPTGCGLFSRSDCWPCLRGSTLLADALKEAEGRGP